MSDQRRKYLLLDGTIGWYRTKNSPPGAVRYDTLKRKRRYKLIDGTIIWLSVKDEKPAGAIPYHKSPKRLYLFSDGTVRRCYPNEFPEKCVRITQGILKIYTLSNYTIINTIGEKVPDEIIKVKTIDKKGRESILEIKN
jgi:hypothetical protein